MATKLLDKVKEQETQEGREKSAAKKKSDDNGSRKRKTLEQISLKYGSKDKQISAKVNGSAYAMFTQINRAQGISNNSALNMILTKYIRENKNILDES